MEAVVNIDGKEVTLKATAYNLIVYRSEFGEDIFKARANIFQAIKGTTVDLETVDSLGVARMTWAMAKTADEKLPSFDTWMRGIENLPVIDLLGRCLNLFLSNMNQISDIKKAPDTEPETDEEK